MANKKGQKPRLRVLSKKGVRPCSAALGLAHRCAAQPSELAGVSASEALAPLGKREAPGEAWVARSSQA